MKNQQRLSYSDYLPTVLLILNTGNRSPATTTRVIRTGTRSDGKVAVAIIDVVTTVLASMFWKAISTSFPATGVGALAKITRLAYGDPVAALDGLAARLVQRLLQVLRVVPHQRGDPVGVHTGQSPETAFAHLAVYKLGGIVVTLSQLYGPETLRHILADCPLRVAMKKTARARRVTVEINRWMSLPRNICSVAKVLLCVASAGIEHR